MDRIGWRERSANMDGRWRNIDGFLEEVTIDTPTPAVIHLLNIEMSWMPWLSCASIAEHANAVRKHCMASAFAHAMSPMETLGHAPGVSSM